MTWIKPLIRTLIQWFTNLHLRHKLLICFGLLVLFSVNMVGVFSYYNVHDYILEQTGQSYQQTLEQVQINIEYRIDTYNEIISQEAGDRALISALARKYASPLEYTTSYLEIIARTLDFKERKRGLENIIIYTNNSTFPIITNRVENIEQLRDKRWYQRYFNDYPTFTVNDLVRLDNTKIWEVEWVEGAPVLYVIKPIIQNYDRLVGILIATVDHAAIFEEYAIVEHDSEESLYIIDSYGTVVFERGDPYNEKLDPSRIERIALSDRLSGIDTSEETLYVHVKGAQSDWIFIREFPMDSLIANATRIRSYTIAITLLSILISFGLAVAIAGMVTRRLGKLSSRMEKIDPLSLDAQIEIDGKDEIGNLSRVFNQMIKRIRELVEQIHVSQEQQKDAEVRALQAQINPHFLYNTLATINWMAMEGNHEKIISMVDNLAVFYRLALNKGKSFLTLEQELEQAKAYADIQKIRLEERIRIEFIISEDIKPLYTLKLIVQPFIENAILHGAEGKEGDTRIVIRGYRDRDTDSVVLEIADDGCGMEHPEQWMRIQHGGYGIRNVNDKIRVQFGSRFGVSLHSEVGTGTRITIRIPVLPTIPQ